MQPSPPKTSEERIQKLKSNPRLWLWFMVTVCGVVLGERLWLWGVTQFKSSKGLGIDFPTLLSLAGTIYAVVVWLVRKIQGVLAVVEGLNGRVATAEVGIKEAQAQIDALEKTVDNHNAKLDYHELRIDYNDARVSGIERDRSN